MSQNTGSIRGMVIAISGGARGIGEATAKALAAAGAKVAVGDLDAELASSSAAQYGGLGLPLDVTSAESYGAFLDKVEAEYGRIDGLVNNAGIMVIGKHLDVPLEAQLKQLDVNLRGVINGCHAIAPRMIAAGGGQIVNIASLAGRFAAPGCAVYSGTKAGVLAFTEALDAELSPQHVRVAAVLPSFTNTGLISGTTAPRLSPAIEPEKVAAAVVSLFEKHRPTRVVPPAMAFSSVSWGMYPNRMRRWMGRKTGMDTMFVEGVDHEARAAYEQRTTGD
jgi:NAD(P)-dependent dehydrogenase (short-subunit alcohol dehydrogenase family)